MAMYKWNKLEKERIDRYLDAVRDRVEEHFGYPNVERRVNAVYEEGYLEWLESFCQGIGFNMGCGEISIGDSLGVDRLLTLATFDGAAFCDMEDLWHYEEGCADYIVSNYIEGAQCPARMFAEWYRVLKPGGTLAIICGDADGTHYSLTSSGPLSRSRKGGIKKFSCFSESTLRFHLNFAKFNVDSIEVDGHVLKVVASKNA